MISTDHVSFILDEAHRLCEALNAIESSGTSSANIKKTDILTVTAILNEGTAFSLLSSTPPWSVSARLTYDDDRIVCIALSIVCFYTIHRLAAKHGNRCAVLVQKLPPNLWPSIFAWQEFLHPMHQRLCPGNVISDPSNVITCFTRPLDILVRLRNGPGVKILLEHPHAVLLYLDLWLYFPRYIDLSPSAAADAYLNVALYVHALLEQREETSLHQLIIADLLRLAQGSPRRLWCLVAELTRYLEKAAYDPSWPNAWELHFQLLTLLVLAPELQCGVMPRSILASIISGAKHCLSRHEWHEDAVEATRLLLTFCGFSFDSRTLVRAIDAGVLHLLWEIGRCGAKYDTLPLAGHIAGSMGLATALRAARRAYGRVLDFLDMDGVDRGKSIAVIREAYALHYRSYFGYRQRKDWKRDFVCHNAQGPHNSTVRICACGRTFYCSGSCQRMHWNARHRAVCSGYEPWSMKGRVSLNDALFLAVHVRERIRQWQPNIVKMIAPDIDRLRPDQQFSITVDISDPLVQKTGDVYIDDVAPDSSSDVVLIKVCFRVGCVDRIQPLPFTYPLADFRTVKKLS